jgi:hypothetical protein
MKPRCHYTENRYPAHRPTGQSWNWSHGGSWTWSPHQVPPIPHTGSQAPSRGRPMQDDAQHEVPTRKVARYLNQHYNRPRPI